ncbi:SRPBCC family protein (plasmid) [Mesorhizobium sp. B2-1-8]|uniref:SRPBCC family protein n=1 Tax=Mesorhizobium sp. B2-1-8 TaxID=2589967 RepID=UPI0011289591|nr:SRPBCC family protein [Mesorhizobium sp. B2-1-8]UCI22933.1 SRPBCC family protein [Mesorhizobium sp. B2-1-8]
MSESGVQVGQIRHVGDGFEARLDRHIGHDRNVIWHMLTAPRALAQWLAPGSIELRAGGVVHIDFAESGRTIKSTVLQLDPPRLLEYSWSSDDETMRPLRWELNATADGTHLLMVLRLPKGEDIAKACAGFDAHLEMLAAALEGVPIGFPVDYFLKARRAYQDLMLE